MTKRGRNEKVGGDKGRSKKKEEVEQACQNQREKSQDARRSTADKSRGEVK